MLVFARRREYENLLPESASSPCPISTGVFLLKHTYLCVQVFTKLMVQCIRQMKFLIAATLLVLGLVTVSSALVDESDSGTAAVKILGGYATRTRFSVLSSTTFKTCITQLGQNAQCQGRRKREAKVLNENLMAADNVREVLLDSSHDEQVVAVDVPEKKEVGKLFVSLTTFTTLTTTTFFENTATTVSVSFHCIPPNGINYEYC
ncbi:uncharacterized protein LOC134772687 [Penaeus indicus]|uniref:uncharacterized protein LOC134772687 n=1 Tax=Penaeus indicus TaxID=29960 RepID=UPI00300C1F35